MITLIGVCSDSPVTSQVRQWLNTDWLYKNGCPAMAILATNFTLWQNFVYTEALFKGQELILTTIF